MAIYSGSYATTQSYERIIVRKDTFWLDAQPLKHILSEREITQKDLWGEKFDFNTACYRAYIGTWEISNDSLFLNEIAPCNYYEYPKGSYPTVDLKKFFPDKIRKNRLFADWVSDELLSPRGKELFVSYNTEEIVYESTVGYVFEGGRLKKTNFYDNNKSKKSEYIDNSELLKSFIYYNIRWEQIKSEIDSTDKKVYCAIISCDDNAKIDSVSVARGFSTRLNSEAIRVVKSIPQWQIIYKKGVRKTPYKIIPIYFNLKNMNQYYQSDSK